MRAIRGVIREIGLWIRYFCVWPGLPPCGSPTDADCILVQAFGRNDYTDAELHTIAGLRQQYQTDTKTVGALRDRSFDPGKPNDELAKETETIMDQNRHLIAFVQWEVAVAFDWYWYLRNSSRIVCLWPPATGYFSTVEVVNESKRKMDRLGLSRPIELAHKRQIVRAFLIVRKVFGQAPIIIRQETYSFDPHSVQPWTRSWLPWLFRETLVRVHHLVKRHVF